MRVSITKRLSEWRVRLFKLTDNRQVTYFFYRKVIKSHFHHICSMRSYEYTLRSNGFTVGEKHVVFIWFKNNGCQIIGYAELKTAKLLHSSIRTVSYIYVCLELMKSFFYSNVVITIFKQWATYLQLKNS